MQILPLDKDRFVAVDGDDARVVKKSEIESSLLQAQMNLDAVTQVADEARSKLVSTDDADPKRKEALEQFNESLNIELYEQEIEKYSDEASNLQAILETING